VRVLRLLLVCAGGALGSGARYLVATWAARALGADFPRGTAIVNLVGSFLLAAVLTAARLGGAIPDGLRLFLTTGVMGGFTTYSSFNWETLGLVAEGRPRLAVLNVLVTVLGCLAAAALGALLARALCRGG
jgi:fluoride exporter